MGRVADADCKAHDAQVTAEEAVLQGTDFAMLFASKREAELLESTRAARADIVVRTDERLAAKVITLLDAAEVRRRAAELGRREAQLVGEITRFEARGVSSPTSLDALAKVVERTAMDHERAVSQGRKLDSWTVTLTGGVIPQTRPVDYYGMVQVGLNLGVLSRSRNEDRFLAARQQEISTARYEIGDQLRRLRAQVKSLREQASRELSISEGEVRFLTSARDALARSDAPNAGQALAVVTLDHLLAESRRTFLAALVAELSRVEGGSP